MAATLIALTPVPIVPMSVLVYRERVVWPTVVGAVVAVGGSTLLFL